MNLDYYLSEEQKKLPSSNQNERRGHRMKEGEETHLLGDDSVADIESGEHGERWDEARLCDKGTEGERDGHRDQNRLGVLRGDVHPLGQQSLLLLLPFLLLVLPSAPSPRAAAAAPAVGAHGRRVGRRRGGEELPPQSQLRVAPRACIAAAMVDGGGGHGVGAGEGWLWGGF